MERIGNFGGATPNHGIWQGHKGNEGCVRETPGPIFPRTGFGDQFGVSEELREAMEHMRSERGGGHPCHRGHHVHHGHSHCRPGKLGPDHDFHPNPSPGPWGPPVAVDPKPPVPDVRAMYGMPIHGDTDPQPPTPDVRAMYGMPVHVDPDTKPPTPDVRAMYGMPVNVDPGTKPPTPDVRMMYGMPMNSQFA